LTARRSAAGGQECMFGPAGRPTDGRPVKPTGLSNT